MKISDISIFQSIKFNRHEVSGAFGDIGTDFPLITGMIIAGGLDSSSVLIMFGVMQIFTGLIYRIPLPVQPLKAMAAIVITEKLTGNVLYAGGLAIGVSMLFLTVTGLVNWIAKVIPKTVVRGIQFGLGFKLAMIALTNYTMSDGISGFILAMLSFIIIVFLMNNKKYPPGILVIMLGIIYALVFKVDINLLSYNSGISFPKVHFPITSDILMGFIVLTIPQIPLSLGNSILGTKQIADDLFPDSNLSIRKISLTYSLINMISPFFSGIPICHGTGGIAGHYAFGARTGGSVIIYGTLYLLLGLFFYNEFDMIIKIFPLPMLGVLLLFESMVLMLFIRDLSESKQRFSIALLIGLIASLIPYGFVIGLVVGMLLYHIPKVKLIS